MFPKWARYLVGGLGIAVFAPTIWSTSSALMQHGGYGAGPSVLVVSLLVGSIIGLAACVLLVVLPSPGASQRESPETPATRSR
jgi:hypothetical protein